MFQIKVFPPAALNREKVLLLFLKKQNKYPTKLTEVVYLTQKKPSQLSDLSPIEKLW